MLTFSPCTLTDPVAKHPSLRRANGPHCTHAYALTAVGAAKLFAHMSKPTVAFSDVPIDMAYRFFIERDKSFKAFVVTPSLIIQHNECDSDLLEPGQTGPGHPWRGSLTDSVRSRTQISDRVEGGMSLVEAQAAQEVCINNRAMLWRADPANLAPDS